MRFFGRRVKHIEKEFNKLLDDIEKQIAYSHLSEIIKLFEDALFQFRHLSEQCWRNSDCERTFGDLQERMTRLIMSMEKEMQEALAQYIKLDN